MKEIMANPARQQKVSEKLMGEVAKDTELKNTAQKAFKSYVRSVHLQPDKSTFNARKLPLAAFAASLGLSATPRVRLGDGSEASREEHRRKKNESKALAKIKAIDEVTDDALKLLTGARHQNAEDEVKKTKWEKLLSRGASRPSKDSKDETTEKEDVVDDLLVVKQRLPAFTGDDSNKHALDVSAGQSTRSKKRLRLDAQGRAKNRVSGTKTLFGDDGEAITPFERMVRESEAREKETETSRSSFIDKVSARLAAEEDRDREAERERLRERRLKKKLKSRAKEAEKKHGGDNNDAPAVATLGGGNYSSDDEEVGGEDNMVQSLHVRDVQQLDTQSAEELALAIIGGGA